MSTFNDQGFEKKLLGLKDSQESISTLSDWCLQNRQHHKKIVATWLSVLKKVRVENRLTLFYLANDVVQYSKRKNYDFVESWGTALQKATTMVRHDKVIDRIMRIFKIWGERSVYSEEFLTDLRGLLTAKKATPATPQAANKQPDPQPTPASTATGEFHQSILFSRINKCKELEDDTDLKLKIVNDCKLINLNDLDAFRAMLKDRKHADGVAGDLDQAVEQVENYTKALEVEILERKAVIDLLHQATKFYESEKSDAKTVFNAYRNFGSRVKSLKRKLDELIPTLSSPVPSPDVNAPSPSPDLDLDLPNDEDLSAKPPPNTKKGPSFNQSGNMESMPFSSFMGSGGLPFDIQTNLFSDDGSNRANVSFSSEGEPEGKPIEVISRRKGEDNFDITNFLKTLAQGSPSAPKPAASALIPGLGDPLPVPPPTIPSDYTPRPATSPSSAPVPPPPMPPMFDSYSQDSRDREEWNTSLPAKFPTWRDSQTSNWPGGNPDAQDGGDWMPALPVPKVPPPPLPQNLETPESPPHFEKESFREPVEYDDTAASRKSSVNSDVDHRSYLGRSASPKDVDHRVLNNRFKKDVDHRNLISLTGSPRELQPPPLPPNLWGDVDQDYRLPRQPPRPGDIVESVDMEMSDEEEIERQQDKGRSREQSPSKRAGAGAGPPPSADSPLKDREEAGKSKGPHAAAAAASKMIAQRFSVPPPTARPPFAPPPPRPLFPDGQFPANRFDSPPTGPDFGAFNNRFPMPVPPPPALPLSGPPPGLPMRLRHAGHPGMGLLHGPNILPPNPLMALQTRSPGGGPASLAHRSLDMSPPTAVPPPSSQGQGTPGGLHSSGPEESDTDSIGQYLNMGLSDDEEIKEMVESMDPQLLQEVVDGINIGNGSDKIDLSSFMPNNGDGEDNDHDWNGQSDFEAGMRGLPPGLQLPAGIRPWKPRPGAPGGGPPPLALGPLGPLGGLALHPPMSPGTHGARFRGHPPNWRSPPMHDRGGMSRGRVWNYRQLRGRGSPGPRQPYAGNW